MGRPKKQIEVPGQSAETTTEAAGDALLLNSAANTPEQLNAAAFQIITKFEAYGFTDEIGHLLTNNLDFIDLVKQATTQTTSTAVINEDGQRKQHKAPVLTDKGWHVPS